jgi:hypothetical protein
MWMGCEPCWRGGVYTYVEQRMAKQSAADEVPNVPVSKHKTQIGFASFLDNGKEYFL